MEDNLKKICEGVEAALSLKQSDFGIVATHYFNLLEEGYLDEIDLYISFKKMEKFVETILPYIKDHIDETKLARGYNKHFVNLSTRGGKPSWDFKNCGDTEYESFIEQKKELDALVKEKENFLKSITKQFVDEETGEVINAPVKRQANSIVLTYIKGDA